MEQNVKHVIMVAAENGALQGGKVGGVADVIRDLPRALAVLGWQVTTIVPSYGFLHVNTPTERFTEVTFPFAGERQTGEFRMVKKENYSDPITHFVFEHPDLRGEPIYYNDPPEAPFLRDAEKYALFCSAVGQFLQTVRTPYLLHLHDWHTATILMLAELHPEFAALRAVKTAFTIHNVSLQGTRPMRGAVSTVERWFPELFETTGWISIWKDARYEVPCYTPMAVGIRFSDKVNTVSPTYAREILKPSDPAVGAIRGEGLEELLQNAATGGRLFGILNGCEYPAEEAAPRIPFAELCKRMLEEIRRPAQRTPGDASLAPVSLLEQKLETWQGLSPQIVLTSITRAVEQKIRLFFEKGSDGRSVLEQLDRMLELHNGVFVILGSGTEDYERLLEEFSRRHPRVLYVKGYYEEISRLLYRNGRLFLMPSLFEPCGISQMIAMREGQPCLVHFVGGLCDTVADRENGFGFEGKTFIAMADNFSGVLGDAINIFLNDADQWRRIEGNAMSARFTWEDSAGQYIKYIYGDEQQ